MILSLWEDHLIFRKIRRVLWDFITDDIHRLNSVRETRIYGKKNVDNFHPPANVFPAWARIDQKFWKGSEFSIYSLITQGNWLESVRCKVYSTIYYLITVFCISQKMAFINLANAPGSTRRARANEKTVKFYHYGKNQVILISFLYERRLYIYSYERNVLGRAQECDFVTLWKFSIYSYKRNYLSLREKIWADSARCRKEVIFGLSAWVGIAVTIFYYS